MTTTEQAYPQWETVTIAHGDGVRVDVRMMRLEDWAIKTLRGWGTTITHVPTGCTVGHHYPHTPDQWPDLLRRLNACGPIPDPASMLSAPYVAWISRVMEVLKVQS